MPRPCLALSAGVLVVTGAIALAPAAPPAPVVPPDAVQWLLREVDRLTEEVAGLRRRLAEARVDAQNARSERDELRQFIMDHHELGDDFVRYEAVKAIAEKDARRRAQEAGRERREIERAEQRARALEARSRREQRRAEESRLDRYRQAGFEGLGLDVFGGRMAFSYATRDGNPMWIDYDPLLGLYYRPGGPSQRIDYGRMTISGSILNASEEVRNLGVAITFFDEQSNQVGSETIQVENARPDVPYPFTSTIEMALDRPFTSSSAYVLYADPAPAARD